MQKINKAQLNAMLRVMCKQQVTTNKACAACTAQHIARTAHIIASVRNVEKCKHAHLVEMCAFTLTAHLQDGQRTAADKAVLRDVLQLLCNSYLRKR